MCVSASAKSSLAAVAAEAEANLELGRLAWAHHALVRADGVKGQESHAGIQAMRGRLAHLRGDHQGALTLLEGVTRKGEWPLKGSVTARNQAWYAEALEASGRREAAIDAYQAATRAAPRSFWGRRAERKARLLL